MKKMAVYVGMSLMLLIYVHDVNWSPLCYHANVTIQKHCALYVCKM